MALVIAVNKSICLLTEDAPAEWGLCHYRQTCSAAGDDVLRCTDFVLLVLRFWQALILAKTDKPRIE